VVFLVENEATRMPVDIQPPTPIEFPIPGTGENVQEHDHGHGHRHEHLDVPGDRSSVHSHSSSQSQRPATVPTVRATSPSLSRSPSPSAPMAYNASTAVERSGLCVICQDEEASPTYFRMLHSAIHSSQKNKLTTPIHRLTSSWWTVAILLCAEIVRIW